MKFIRFENRLINLEAIANVQFFPPTDGDRAQLHIEYMGLDTLDRFYNDEATLLWSMLCEAIAAAEAADSFASMAATAIMTDFGRNGGAADA